jgi:molybdopterin-guanine dinucleotide biosynthesis protein A
MDRTIIPGMAGAVLSGGAGSRMGGRCKALLPFRGRPLIARPLELLRGVFGGAVIIANDPAGYAGLGARVLPDIIKGKGPLGGIHAALAGCGGRPVFVAACDMPFLDEALVRALAARWLQAGRGAVLPRAGGLLEPLCGVYGPELAAPLAAFLRSSPDLSVRAFLGAAETSVLDLGEAPAARRSFANVNFPRDLEALA